MFLSNCYERQFIMKQLTAVNTSEFVDISGTNFKTICAIDSYEENYPSNSAIATIAGYVDREGNLYYQTVKGVLKKRTANLVNDFKKSYRLCIGGEKFTISVDIAKAKEAFRIRDLKGDKTGNTTYGFIVFADDTEIVELKQSFKTHREAEEALLNTLKEWDDTYYHGIVFSTNGKTMKTKMEVTYE